MFPRAQTTNSWWSDTLNQRIIVCIYAIFLIALQCKVVVLADDSIGEGRERGDIREVELPDKLPCKLVWLSPGQFLMGQDGVEQTEMPVHTVQLDGFWIGQTEITQAQFKSLMGMELWAFDQYAKENPSHAANYITYDEAIEFCKKLTAQERNAGRLAKGWKYTLPTEAQWEYACRAGTTSTFSCGDSEWELEKHAWLQTNTSQAGEPYPHEVAKKKPNDWKLYDMHGNVLEFCLDNWTHKYTDETLVVNPIGVNQHAGRILRGGGFLYHASELRSSRRFHGGQSERAPCYGFRIVCTRSVSASRLSNRAKKSEINRQKTVSE